MQLSDLYGMDIYTDDGKYLGQVHSIILDLEEGKISRIMLVPLEKISGSQAERLIKQYSIMYDKVRSVEDVVIVSKSTETKEK
ncbi:MAG: PRC-barrel domain-containing protein [Candidatus Micrarchaeia archaeon]|jgi:sporulation protein YlmC with PRC-barrel domain